MSNIISNRAVFADYARYYDLIYRDKDYPAETEYVVNLLHRFHPSVHSILELGSGTGIHASLLADKGFSVHGIEQSEEMLLRSRSLVKKSNMQSSRLTFDAGDIREVRLEKRFDAVIALFHVMSYQTSNDDVRRSFETVKHHLKPGGIFIFDVWYGPAVLTQRPSVRIKRMTDEKIEIARLAEPRLHINDNRVDVSYHMFVRDLSTQVVSELRETHAMRYFFRPEIECIADHSGLQILHAEEWLAGNPIGPETWGVCFCVQSTKKL
ncbi:MAG: class I SAM-dependent methyltransferase [Deltaproteobacteria bacterium]|nr:class I SAM-dependent methyltransferase [Deltaproteobacteria bacterium]